jgi:hypothetical protein
MDLTENKRRFHCLRLAASTRLPAPSFLGRTHVRPMASSAPARGTFWASPIQGLLRWRLIELPPRSDGLDLLRGFDGVGQRLPLPPPLPPPWDQGETPSRGRRLPVSLLLRRGYRRPLGSQLSR